MDFAFCFTTMWLELTSFYGAKCHVVFGNLTFFSLQGRFVKRSRLAVWGNTDFAWVLAVCLVTSLLYMFSMDNDIGFWDTGEMQTVPYILGLAHSNGFPTEILLGWLFSHIVVFGTPAFRLTLLSTACSAGSAVICFLISRNLEAPRSTAFSASVLFAATPLVWDHSTHVDVINMTVTFAALATVFSLSTSRDKADWKLLVSGASVGLALGTHLAVIFYLPVCIAFLAFRSSMASFTKRLIIFALVSLIFAMLVYSYMPIRSSIVERLLLDPTIRIGLGTGQPIWDWGAPSNPPRLIAVVTGASVGAGHAFAGFLDLKAYVGYFVHGGRLLLNGYSAFVVLPLAVIVFTRFKHDIAILLIPFLLVSPFAVSFTSESDSDRYFIFPILCLCVAVAVACGRLSSKKIVRSSIAMILIAASAAEVYQSRGNFEGRSDRLGSTYVANIVQATQSNAIIIAPWVYGTPLTYAAYALDELHGRNIVLRDLDESTFSFARTWRLRRPVYVISEAPKLRGFHFLEALHVNPDPLHDPKLFEQI